MTPSAEDSLRALELVDAESESYVRSWTDRLIARLGDDQSKMTRRQWRSHVDLVRTHPISVRLREDPFTGRCFAKPRGYAGDAVALDFIYGHASVQSQIAAATQFGRYVHKSTFASAPSQAVRDRRDILAREIDAVCFSRASARILSLAAGHLREWHQSAALAEGNVGEVVAIDQDRASLEVVEREFADRPVIPVTASAKALTSDFARTLGTFDFVYSAGLYDYLSDAFATQLTTSLIKLLRPGGKLWIANFAPGVQGRAYMEAIMDWWLVYRDESQLRSLVSRSLGLSDLPVRSFLATSGNIAFLEVVRR